MKSFKVWEGFKWVFVGGNCDVLEMIRSLDIWESDGFAPLNLEKMWNMVMKS